MSERIETVVIGTALTPSSDDVVRAGLAFARALGARVHLLHAFTPPADFSGGSWLSDPAVDEMWRAQKKVHQSELEEQIERVGIRPEELHGKSFEVGTPHQLLVDVARTLNAMAVVVGASEARGLSRAFGSTAGRVIRKSTRPVLLVRGEPRPPRRFLLPVDLSALSVDAFRSGLEVIDRWAGGDDVEREALLVVTESQQRVFAEHAGEGASAEEVVGEELSRFVAEHAGGAAVSCRVRVGDARREILAEIDDLRPDVVVLGTHGRSGFERLVIGSVAEGVSREAACGVLVIPPEAALRTALRREARALAGAQPR